MGIDLKVLVGDFVDQGLLYWGLRKFFLSSRKKVIFALALRLCERKDAGCEQFTTEIVKDGLAKEQEFWSTPIVLYILYNYVYIYIIILIIEIYMFPLFWVSHFNASKPTALVAGATSPWWGLSLWASVVHRPVQLVRGRLRPRRIWPRQVMPCTAW